MITVPGTGIKPFTKTKLRKFDSPFGHPYIPDAFSSNNGALLTCRSLREKQILALSYAIRQKPEWWIKYKNPEIVAKWREEAVKEAPANASQTAEAATTEEANESSSDSAIPPEISNPSRVSPAVFDYVIAELALHEKIRADTGNHFQHAYFDYLLFGDKVVPETLKEQFKKIAQRLENIPENEKDWHPGSNQRVLDLVHPSLYPLQYGRTPLVADLENDHVGLQTNYAGTTVVAPAYDFKQQEHKPYVSREGISQKYQWLPAVFNISEPEEGKLVPEITIESYINNLHPVLFKDLYQPIADIFAQFVPAVNASLTQYASAEYTRDNPNSHENGLYGPEPNYDRSDPNYWDRYQEYIDAREPVMDELVFKMPDEESPDRIQIDVRGTKLKVIVKMANIELTPERPDYPGGSWHVEGAINEDIVCTCLYYYDVENITHSQIDFRAGFSDPEYEQGDDSGTMKVYGMENEKLASFPLGSVDSLEDRLIVFPNMFQHHVAPFELADKTKPGHRKILCFFVCDPFDNTVVSTDQVPPQQIDWWYDSFFAAEAVPTQLTSLPGEVLSSIMGHVDWPMGLAEAKEIREKLMEERAPAPIDPDDSDNPFLRTFNLCEH